MSKIIFMLQPQTKIYIHDYGVLLSYRAKMYDKSLNQIHSYRSSCSGNFTNS